MVLNHTGRYKNLHGANRFILLFFKPCYTVHILSYKTTEHFNIQNESYVKIKNLTALRLLKPVGVPWSIDNQ